MYFHAKSHVPKKHIRKKVRGNFSEIIINYGWGGIYMKKIISIGLSLVLLFTLVGCNRTNLEEYENALKKSAQIKKSEMILEANITNDFREQVLFQQGLFGLNGFENISYKQRTKVDMEVKKVITEISTDIGGIAADFNMYLLDNRFFVEFLSPAISPKKYIEVNQGDVNFFNMQTFEEYEKNKDKNLLGVSDNTFKLIKDKWLEILSEENVFKGEKILITTEVGEVKAREYTIETNKEQLKELSSFAFDTLLSSGEIERGMEENLTKQNDPELINQGLNMIKRWIEDAKDLSFIYKAYIDMDGYIVEEKIDIIYESGQKYQSPLRKTQLRVNTQYLNIGKSPDFHMEEPNDKNTIKLEDLDLRNFPLFN